MSTTSVITRISDFDSTLLNYRGTGVRGTAAASTTTNIDYKLPEDRLALGAEVILKGHVFDDSMTFQVIDIDGVLAPAGTVLNQFIVDWNVVEDTQLQPEKLIPYPAKIFSGLYIRLIYTSTGSNTVSVHINYDLHKVLH